MKFSYRIGQEDGKWVAECVEVEAAGEGKSAADAVMTLRDVLAERFAPQAVAPPSGGQKPLEIELTQVPETLTDAPAPSKRDAASLS